VVLMPGKKAVGARRKGFAGIHSLRKKILKVGDGTFRVNPEKGIVYQKVGSMWVEIPTGGVLYEKVMALFNR
jgi:hypothetical protein